MFVIVFVVAVVHKFLFLTLKFPHVPLYSPHVKFGLGPEQKNTFPFLQ